MTHIDQEVNNETFASNTTSQSEQEMKMETTTKTTIQVLRDFPAEGVDSRGRRLSTKELRDVTYSPDELTVVTSTDRDKVYTKINVFDDVKCIGKVSFSNQFFHTVKNVHVPHLGVLESELRKMNDDTASCVILGQLFDELTGSRTIRRIKNGDWEVVKRAAETEDGTAAMKWAPHCFAEVPRSWACFDVDGKGDAEVIFPGAHLWTEETPAAERAQQTAQWLVNVWMPKEITHKDAVVQWSSSYALDGRLERVRAHVWVRFTAPLTCQQLTSWAKLVGPTCAPDGKQYIATKPDGTHIVGGRRLDYSTVRHGVQPNFTAAPLFNLGGELVPSKTDPTKFVAVKGGTTFPDPHHDYRVLRVNGRGSWGWAVDAAPFIAAGQAAEAAEAAKQKSGSAKGPKVATVQAPVSTADWSAKDRADYELAQACLDFLGSDVYGPYEEWFATGCSIKSRFPGSEGLALWTDWSLRWEGSDPLSTPAVCEGFWDQISPTRAGGPSRGFGRLINEAKRRGMTTKTTELQNMTENETDGSPIPGVPGVGAPDYGDEIPMFELNAAGHVQRIKAAWGSKLRYVTDWDRWCVFYNGRWTRLKGSSRAMPDGVISAMIKFSMSNLLVEGKRAGEAARVRELAKCLAAGLNEADARKQADKVAASVYRKYEAEEYKRHEASAQSGLLQLLSNETSLRVSLADWDKEPHLIGTKNGVVDLRTGELSPLTPDRMVLRWADVTYKPELAGTCVEYYNFTDSSMMLQTDTEMTEEAKARGAYLRKTNAFFLTGEVKARQKFYIWHGTSGANGKSTLISLLAKMLRQCETSGYFVTVQAATLLASQRAAGGPTSDLMAFQGMRLAVLPEIGSQGGRLDMGFIKGVTSGDTISGRPPHGKQQVSFDPTCKLVMACNTVPSFASDGGTARRLEVTGFERSWADPDSKDATKPKADVHLPAKLEAEMDAIFATLVKECVELYANGFRIEVPESIRNVTAELNDDMNPLKEFIDRFCTRCDETTRASQLSDEFERWRMTRRGIRAYSPNAFSDEMKRLGIEKKVTNQGKMYVGIRVNRVLLDQHCLANSSFNN